MASPFGVTGALVNILTCIGAFSPLYPIEYIEHTCANNRELSYFRGENDKKIMFLPTHHTYVHVHAILSVYRYIAFMIKIKSAQIKRTGKSLGSKACLFPLYNNLLLLHR